MEKVLHTRRGFVVTVVGVEGHSYKPEGHRALYEVDGIRPLHGNLGSLCVDQELLRQGRLACDEEKPRRIRIDTSQPSDIHVGHGAFCGGRMELLIEPLGSSHRPVYEALGRALAAGEGVHLLHRVDTGELSLSFDEPAAADELLVEEFPSLARLLILGATPLAELLLRAIDELPLRIHVVDWRPAHLQAMQAAGHVHREEDLGQLDRSDLLLVLSHDFERDRAALQAGLRAECRWIGLLSSRARRDRMFEELQDDGFEQAQLARIASPVGLPIGGRSDAEIAISIAAQLVGELQ